MVLSCRGEEITIPLEPLLDPWLEPVPEPAPLPELPDELVVPAALPDELLAPDVPLDDVVVEAPARDDPCEVPGEAEEVTAVLMEALPETPREQLVSPTPSNHSQRAISRGAFDLLTMEPTPSDRAGPLRISQ